MNNQFLFNSIINAKAKHLGKNHQFIYCQLPNGQTVKAYALTHVSSSNVSVVKIDGNYYCFCGSAPFELSRNTKEQTFNVKRVRQENTLLFLLIDITKSIENNGVLKAIEYINANNYSFYQYLSFGDTTGYISAVLNKTNVLIELQNYYDNYNLNYDDEFYHSEGTDLPENGVDALNDALLSLSNQYESIDFYLVTDNNKYSRNISNPVDILTLINGNINKLYFDIVQPVNENQITETLTFPLDTYIDIYVDYSGSMNESIPTINNAISELGNKLVKILYGTEENRNKYFSGSLYWADERWLSLVDSNINKNNLITIVFINESNSVYHRVPRNTSLEPTTTFNSNLINFINTYNTKDFAIQKLYSVDSSGIWTDDVIAFNAHVIDAINGNSPYSTNLLDYNWNYTLNIASNSPASYYLDDILNLLQDNSKVSAISTEDLMSGNFVNVFKVGDNIYVKKASCTNNTYSNGFILNSCLEGETIDVFTIGINTELSGLITGNEYYLGIDGEVQTTEPSEGIIQIIGEARNSNSLYFYLYSPITELDPPSFFYTNSFPPSDNIIYL